MFYLQSSLIAFKLASLREGLTLIKVRPVQAPSSSDRNPSADIESQDSRRRKLNHLSLSCLEDTCE